jgi:hypothetical protein
VLKPIAHLGERMPKVAVIELGQGVHLGFESGHDGSGSGDPAYRLLGANV